MCPWVAASFVLGGIHWFNCWQFGSEGKEKVSWLHISSWPSKLVTQILKLWFLMLLQLQKFKRNIVFNLRSISFRGFPGGSDGKESAYNAGHPGLIPGLGRSPGEGNGHPIHHSCLENPMDTGAWGVTVHEVTEADMTEWLTLSPYWNKKIHTVCCILCCITLLSNSVWIHRTIGITLTR